MDTEYLKRQAIFRLVVFFVIAVVVGFIASDINILMSQWGTTMFKITEETKTAAIEAMREILTKNATLTDEELGEAFEAAVDIVKKQFGM